MSGLGSAASSGAVLGAVIVFLLQQFGYFSLSGLVDGIVYLIVGLVAGGIVGALIGWAILRRR